MPDNCPTAEDVVRETVRLHTGVAAERQKAETAILKALEAPTEEKRYTGVWQALRQADELTDDVVIAHGAKGMLLMLQALGPATTARQRTDLVQAMGRELAQAKPGLREQLKQLLRPPKKGA